MPELTVGSVAWWLDRLDKRLNDKRRRDRLTKLTNYYVGNHPLLFATEEARDVFANMLAGLSINFVALVVDAPVERLLITGFRSVGSLETDAEANRIWRDNDMDAWSIVAHREALSKSECAIAVGPGLDPETPLISVEDARTIVVEATPGRVRERRAALKRWADDKSAYATLYLPDGVYKFSQALNTTEQEKLSAGRVEGIIETSTGGWKRREVDDEAWPLANPTGVVPVIPMVNRPDLLGMGRSEMEPVLPIQDAINKEAWDMLIASEFAAFPQRWMTGVETVDPETGEDRFDFRGAIDRILTVGDPTARMGIFQAAELGNYLKAIEALGQHMAAISHTPRHYLVGSGGVIPTGEANTSAESGLANKVRAHQKEKTPIWSEVQRVAALMSDRAMRPTHPIWADAEHRSWNEQADAVSKELAAGIPLEFLLPKLGYGPEDIERIMRLREEEAQRMARAFDPSSPYFDPAELSKRSDVMGVLVRAGVDGGAAAEQAGLPGLVLTGERPVTTRPANGNGSGL